MNKIFLTLLLFVYISCATTPKEPGVHITLLHTNDHHGRFWANEKGEYGLAARATLIEDIRLEVAKKGGHVLLLDAGDVNTGIPQSDILQAEPDFIGMNFLGYDVMALGNHEFDNDLEVLRNQQLWAAFPFISANAYHKGKKERLFSSHIVKNLGGVVVTIFGLTTEDTPLKSKLGAKEKVTFRPVLEEAKDIVPELRKNTDVLIALTHMGHYPDEKNGADAPGDVSLARKVNGIDLIIGGHTQKALFEPDVQNGTIIVQAEEWGKYVGRIDLIYHEGKLRLKNYQLIPVNYMESKPVIVEKLEVLALLKPYKEKGDETLLIDVGISEGNFDGERRSTRNSETNLGNFLTSIYKEKLKADIGITNGGGIRASLPEGKITYASILTVVPFSNEIGLASMSGKELQAYLTYLITEFGPIAKMETGSFPHLSGVSAEISLNKKTVSKIKINGNKLDHKKMYKIAISNFLAGGGDKYPKLKNFQTFGFVDADLVRNYIEEKKIIKARDFEVRAYLKVTK